jgi:hypothetical protein
VLVDGRAGSARRWVKRIEIGRAQFPTKSLAQGVGSGINQMIDPIFTCPDEMPRMATVRFKQFRK